MTMLTLKHKAALGHVRHLFVIECDQIFSDGGTDVFKKETQCAAIGQYLIKTASGDGVDATAISTTYVEFLEYVDARKNDVKFANEDIIKQTGDMTLHVKTLITPLLLGDRSIATDSFNEMCNLCLDAAICDYPLLPSTCLTEWKREVRRLLDGGQRNLKPNPKEPRWLVVKPKLDVLFEQFIVRQIYQYLVEKAFQGETTTYSEIAVSFGLPGSGNQLGAALSPILSKIFIFCVNSGQPHLTSLVVRKSGEDKGLPGGGFWDLLRGHGNLDVPPQRPARREVTADLQNEVFSYWSKLGL